MLKQAVVSPGVFVRGILVILSSILAIVESSARERIAAVSKEGLVGLEDRDWEVRRNAALQLGKEAPEDKESILALVGAVRDEDSRVRRAAADALGEIGSKSKVIVAVLTEILHDSDGSVREAAAEVLQTMGPRARSALPVLLELLGDSQPRVRRAAARAVGAIGPRNRDASAALLDALDDDDALVRQVVVEAVGKVGKSSLPSLIQMLDDEEPEVRSAAVTALGNLGKSALPDLMAHLAEGRPDVLHSVYSALVLIGAAAAPDLTEALQDDFQKSLIRQYAARALGEIGVQPRTIVPALLKTLDAPDDALRGASLQALGQFEAQAAEAFPALLEILENPDEDPLVRSFAASAVARIRPHSEETSIALRKALGDENDLVQKAALAAFSRISLDQPEEDIEAEIARQLARLRKGDPNTRQNSIEALGRMSSAAARAVPRLVILLADSGMTSERRRSAAMALGAIGPSARDAVASLIEVFRDPQEQIALRIAAVSALGLIGPSANSAVLPLIDLLGKNETPFRAPVLLALERIGPRPKAQVTALLHALDDRDLEARELASRKIRNFTLDRAKQWQPYLSHSSAPVLRLWTDRLGALYGVDGLEAGMANADRGRQELAIFDVIGGRAATRETLQMQSLEVEDMRGSDYPRPSLPIYKFKGVEVKSHPYEDMLRKTGSGGDSLALADFVPKDRCLLYFTSLQALTNALKEGSELLLRFSTAATRSNIEYSLAERYLERLGFDGQWLLEVLATGSIDEVGIVLPDLFLVDGTDITVLLRIPGLSTTKGQLRLPGLDDLNFTEVQAKPTRTGDLAYRAVRGEFLIFSSNRQELQSVLDLFHLRNRARYSLGRSAEFRYMLHQLPVLQETQAYAYLSDDFIRRLVGPQVKIGQYRRLQARANLVRLTAGALLYKLDGHYAPPTLNRLLDYGYIPHYLHGDEYSLRADLTAESRDWGTLYDSQTLVENPVIAATPAEAKAYAGYVSN